MGSVRAGIYVAILLGFLRRILGKALSERRKARMPMPVQGGKWMVFVKIRWQRGMDGPLKEGKFALYRNLPFDKGYDAWCLQDELNSVAWNKINMQCLLNSGDTSIRVVEAGFYTCQEAFFDPGDLPGELEYNISMARIDMRDTVENAIDKVCRESEVKAEFR